MSGSALTSSTVGRFAAIAASSWPARSAGFSTIAPSAPVARAITA
jgi:hypothetical protein